MILGIILNLNTNLQALLCVLSFVILHIFIKKVCNKKIIEIIIFFTCIVLLIFYFHSRTGVLAIIAVIIYTHPTITLKKYSFPVIIIGSLGLFLFKTQSTTGRLFILKNSLQILKEHLWYGVNSYNLEANHLQAAYTANNGLTDANAWLLDNNFYCLNDWLQFTILYGLAGFLVIGICLFGFVKIVRITYLGQNTVAKNICILLIPFHVFMLFSYPLQIPWLLLLYIILYSSLVLQVYTLPKIWKILSWFLLIPVLWYGVLHCYKQYLFQKQVSWCKEQLQIGNKTNAVNALEKLTNNPFITYDAVCTYAGTLLELQQPEKAISILKKKHPIACTYEYHLLLGNCYAALSDYYKAITEYTTALYIVPHKLQPRYALMNLYGSLKDTSTMHYWANDILNYPIKIPTYRAHFYKKEALHILRQNSIKVKN